MGVIDPLPPEIARYRGRLVLAELSRRERMAQARRWAQRDRRAMAWDAVQAARQWNTEYRRLRGMVA